MDTMGKFGESLAVALANGSSVAAAIEVVGCSRSHGYRLSRLPEVRRRVAELRTMAASEAVGALTAASSKAVAVLVSVMDSEAAKDADKITAAKVVLSMVGPMGEIFELRSRLDAIEQRTELKVVS